MKGDELVFWWAVLAVVSSLAWFIGEFCLPLVCSLLIICLFGPYQYLQSQAYLDLPSFAEGARAAILQPYHAPLVTILTVTLPWVATFDSSSLSPGKCLALVPASLVCLVALARIKALLRHSWEAEQQRLLEDIGNSRSVVGDGLAIGYYVGYLKNLFSECEGLDFVKRLRSFEQQHRMRLASHKIYILSFTSCTNNHSAFDVMDKVGEPLKMQYTRGGVTRTINNTVYRGRIPGIYPGVYLDDDEFYVICETLSPISTISSMDCVGFSKDDKLRTLRRLTAKLNEFLQEDPSIRDYVRLMEIDDINDRRPLNQLLWEQIEKDHRDIKNTLLALQAAKKKHEMTERK
ncbi:stimulator of interferon genes protein-like isoform X1 [Penaeus vannamei]|uniref:stimulator of interferon genes protein-like isoform X1 n=1 Tax=Penaeus vannamei TaxID=6689 RepID=UPI00387F460F